MAEEVRILFAEDSPEDCDLERRLLERDGFVVDWCRVESEVDLRRELAAFAPHVVLSDFTMPEFSGRDCLGIVREQAPFTPFIFVSGTIGEEAAAECLRGGATDYVLKDNLRRLPAAVRRALTEAEERRKLHETESIRERLSEVLEATSDIVMTYDLDGRITYINDAGQRLLGYSPEELLGHPSVALYAPWTTDILRNESVPVALEQGCWQGEAALLSKGGEEVPVSLVVLAHKQEDGATRFLSAIARDERSRRALEARISYLANYNALTDLPNRRLLQDRLEQAIVQARLKRRAVVLLVFDLDRLKLINESFGIAEGDRVLIDVAARLRACVPEPYTVAYLGGDEFAVLVPDLAQAEEAYALSRKIAETMSVPISIEGCELSVRSTIGAAAFPEDGDDAQAILRCAEVSLSHAKTESPGEVRFYAAHMTQAAQERLAIEAGLQTALRKNGLALHYQPQYTLRRGHMVGVEALLRWPGARGDIGQPSRFIPVAEESGLIRPIGEWVLKEACSTALHWRSESGEPLRIAVNVSPQQLQSGELVDQIVRTLDATGLEPERLEIEVTESALMKDIVCAIDVLRRIRDVGVRVAIDDFGTGLSSLSYLSRMPVDVLKIDRSFVQRMTHDKHDAAIVQSIVSMGRGLGITVVAEGVETSEQSTALTRLGCQLAQGYLLAAPMPAGKLELLLTEPRGNA